MGSLSKKASCMGCKALVGGEVKYECLLGLPINFQMKNGLAFAPVPVKRCHRPKTDVELKMLQERQRGKKDVVEVKSTIPQKDV